MNRGEPQDHHWAPTATAWTADDHADSVPSMVRFKLVSAGHHPISEALDPIEADALPEEGDTVWVEQIQYKVVGRAWNVARGATPLITVQIKPAS